MVSIGSFKGARRENRLVSWLAGWLVGWSVGWLGVGWLTGWLGGWLVGWLAGWLVACLLAWMDGCRLDGVFCETGPNEQLNRVCPGLVGWRLVGFLLRGWSD